MFVTHTHTHTHARTYTEAHPEPVHNSFSDGQNSLRSEFCIVLSAFTIGSVLREVEDHVDGKMEWSVVRGRGLRGAAGGRAAKLLY